MEEQNKRKAEAEWVDKWESQMRKGMLDFIILQCLEHHESYGYDLIRFIRERAALNLSEGTIYPLLNRLKSEELITSRWEEMATGIPRKYYRITEKGKNALALLKASWSHFRASLERLLENKE